MFPCDCPEERRAACAQRASLRPVNVRSAGKSIGASAGLQRLPMACALPILPHAETSACPAVGQLGNRLADLFGKRARTFCRYLHHGRFRVCPSFVPICPAKLSGRCQSGQCDDSRGHIERRGSGCSLLALSGFSSRPSTSPRAARGRLWKVTRQFTESVRRRGPWPRRRCARAAARSRQRSRQARRNWGPAR